MRLIALSLVVAVFGCHARDERRVHQIHPIDSETAIAVWSRDGGAQRRLGLVHADGTELWSVPAEDRISRFVVSQQSAYVESETATGDIVVAYATKDGSRQWSHSLAGVDDARASAALRLTGDALVISTSQAVLALDASTGTVRAQADGIFVPSPSVAGNFVVLQTDTGVTALSVLDGHRSSRPKLLTGCATTSELIDWENGQFVGRALNDLTTVRVVASAPADEAWSIEECGVYGSREILLGNVLGSDRVMRRAVLALEAGKIVARADLSDQGAPIKTSYGWADRTGLRGLLPRFVPVQTRLHDVRATRLLDLDTLTLGVDVGMADPFSFSPDGSFWLLVGSGAPVQLKSVNGVTGATSTVDLPAEQIPAVSPADVAAGTIWLPGSWSKDEKLQFQRFRMDLKPAR